jgi:phosphate:Na+ symporter
MGKSVQKMFGWLRITLIQENKNEKIEKQIFRREQVLDLIQKEVVEFVSKILTGTVPQDITDEARRQLRLADEYESISDYIANALKILLRMKNNDVGLTKQGKNELLNLHDSLTEYLDSIYQAIGERDREILNKAISENSAIRRKIKTYRNSHFNRLASDQISPMMDLIYMDLLNMYRRMLDHALNIAEVISGEK